MADDIIREINEDVKKERLKAIWKKYGKILSNIVFIVLLCAFIYIGWSKYTRHKQEKENFRFNEAVKFIEKKEYEAAENELKTLLNSSFKGVKILAHFKLAELYKIQENDKKAIEVLDNIIKDSHTETSFKQLATIYKTLSEFDTIEPKNILDTLAPLRQEEHPLRFIAYELSALAAEKQKDLVSMNEFIDILIKDEKTPEAIKKRVEQMKSRHITE